MQFNLKFKDEGVDARICTRLLEQPNLTQYIRELVLADMNNRQYTDALIQRVREELLHTGELEMQLEELQKKYDRMNEKLEALKEDLINGTEN